MSIQFVFEPSSLSIDHHCQCGGMTEDKSLEATNGVMRSENRLEGASGRRIRMPSSSRHGFALLLFCLMMWSLNIQAIKRNFTVEFLVEQKVAKAKTNKDSKSNVLSKLAALNCTPTAKSSNGSRGKPIWIPGYPGSGSEMLRSVVHRTTGLVGADFYKDNRCISNHTVTCKTHWPALNYLKNIAPGKFASRFHDRYMVLLRNPRNAIPSLYNFIWEKNHKVASHSVQAPIEDWRRFRDTKFDLEMHKWQSLVLKWRQQPYDLSIYIPYEKLTNPETGPTLFSKIAQEIRRANHTIAKDQDISCLWYNTVVAGRSKTKRAPHKYRPGYTNEQKAKMITMLTRLIQESSDDPSLVEILLEYIEDIKANMPIDDERS